MKIGVLGTGMVGRSIATKLVSLGHEVMMGSRTAGNEAATEWVAASGARASQGTFADAVAFGELLVNCTAGAVSVDAIGSARAEDLDGKTLVDVANPLDFSHGMPPSLFVPSTDSLAEQIQRAFPDARVIKTLNMVNHEVMVEPSKVPGEHDVFVCGNDDAASAQWSACSRASAGPRRRSTTSVTSWPHATWRRISCSGFAFGARSAPATSTSGSFGRESHL